LTIETVDYNSLSFITEKNMTLLILQNGLPINDLSKYQWDAETRTVSSDEDYISIPYQVGSEEDGFTVTLTGKHCNVHLGSYCSVVIGPFGTVNLDDHCKVQLGENCTCKAGRQSEVVKAANCDVYSAFDIVETEIKVPENKTAPAKPAIRAAPQVKPNKFKWRPFVIPLIIIVAVVVKLII
jgi:hypothetical protein